MSKEAVSKAEAAAVEARQIDQDAKSRERIIAVSGGVAAAILTVIVSVVGMIQGCNSSSLSGDVKVLTGRIETLESNLKTDERLKKLESRTTPDDRLTKLESRPDLAPRLQKLEKDQTLQDEVKQLEDMVKSEANRIMTDSATENAKLRQELKELKETLGRLQKQASGTPPTTNTEAPGMR